MNTTYIVVLPTASNGRWRGREPVAYSPTAWIICTNLSIVYTHRNTNTYTVNKQTKDGCGHGAMGAKSPCCPSIELACLVPTEVMNGDGQPVCLVWLALVECAILDKVGVSNE